MCRRAGGAAGAHQRRAAAQAVRCQRDPLQLSSGSIRTTVSVHVRMSIRTRALVGFEWLCVLARVIVALTLSVTPRTRTRSSLGAQRSAGRHSMAWRERARGRTTTLLGTGCAHSHFTALEMEWQRSVTLQRQSSWPSPVAPSPTPAPFMLPCLCPRPRPRPRLCPCLCPCPPPLPRRAERSDLTQLS